jgi:hypothetical protein
MFTVDLELLFYLTTYLNKDSSLLTTKKLIQRQIDVNEFVYFAPHLWKPLEKIFEKKSMSITRGNAFGAAFTRSGVNRVVKA